MDFLTQEGLASAAMSRAVVSEGKRVGTRAVQRAPSGNVLACSSGARVIATGICGHLQEADRFPPEHRFVFGVVPGLAGVGQVSATCLQQGLPAATSGDGAGAWAPPQHFAGQRMHGLLWSRRNHPEVTSNKMSRIRAIDSLLTTV